MRKKLIFVICVLALASISFAEVIGNWEQTMDDWADLGGTTLSYSPGGTLDNYSLRVVAPATSFAPIISKILTTDQINKIVDGTYTEFTLDVIRWASDWMPDGSLWTPESRLLFSLSATAFDFEGYQMNYGVGQERFGAEWYPSSIPEGHLPPGMTEPDPDGPMTASWDLAVDAEGIRALIDAGYIYDMTVDIRLLANSLGYMSPVTYYLDNAQLVPEPATLVLLSLGLAMLRRKH